MGRIFRVMAWTVLVGGVVLAAFILSAFIFIQTADLRQEAERYASFTLGRSVTIGALQIKLGRDIAIDIQNFHLASPSWGTEPDMASFEHLSAVLDAGSLWRGRVLLRDLSIDGLRIFLERDKDGKGNWKFKGSTPYVPRDPFTHEAKERSDFPIILNGVLRNGQFRMKTTGGTMIRIDGDDLKMSSVDDKSPVILLINGAYNGMNAQLDVAGDSYAVLRDPSTPYPAKVKIIVGRSKVSFDGTLTDPVNADGIKGAATLNASVLDDIYKVLGLALKGKFPLLVDGDLTRAGDLWVFENQQGSVAGSQFTGDSKLIEGARGEADSIAVDIAFKVLDMRPLIDGTSGMSRKTKMSDIDNLSLQADQKPGVLADARIRAGQVVYDDYKISDLDLRAQNKPGWISLDPFSFGVVGGRAEVNITLDATGKTPHLFSRIKFNNADIERILRFRNFSESLITGRLSALAELNMYGETIHKGLRNSRGGVVTFLKKGRVSRDLVDEASMDILALFRDEEGWAPISCFLGIYSMHNGQGYLMPLRFVTPELTFYGVGPINLLTRQVDIILQGNSQHTLALDIPLQLTGPFSDIDITPLVFGEGRDADFVAEKDLINNLPPALRNLAKQNYCTH